MTETMTIKKKNALNTEEHKACLEQEIESLEMLVSRRAIWLEKPENKRRSTYNSVMRDTREMEEKLDDLKDELNKLKTQQ